MHSRFAALTTLFLLLALISAPQALFSNTVSGRVTDPDGQGCYPVDIDVTDAVTGDPIPVFGDSTDSAGYYSIFLYDGVYNIYFIPDPSSGCASIVAEDVDVQAPLTLDVTAPWGVAVSGIVTDPDGQPAANLDIDVRDSSTGDELFLASDNTDAAGSYSLFIPAGTFHIVYKPGQSHEFASLTKWDVPIQSDTTVNAQMPISYLLSGQVTDGNGIGVPNVDLDVDDALTSRRIYTPHDDTDQDGNYSIYVPEGFLDVAYEAPVGAGLADNAIWSLVVRRDLDLNITLPNGWLVSGYVTDSGGTGVFNVDIDVDDSITGERLPTSHDNTDADGFYQIYVPTGTYDISFEPPPGVVLLGDMIEARNISSDTQIDRSLGDGYAVYGSISDESGSPVAGCDVDVYDVDSGLKLFTPNDNSNDAGNYLVVVPAGTYDIVFQPRIEDGLDELTQTDVDVSGNLNLNAQLVFNYNQAITLLPVNASIFPGDLFSEKITIYNNDLVSRRVQVSLAAVLPGGGTLTILPPYPPNGVNLRAGRQLSGYWPIPVPPAAPPGLRVDVKGFILDYAQGDTLNVDITNVEILDPENPTVLLGNQ